MLEHILDPSFEHKNWRFVLLLMVICTYYMYCIFSFVTQFSLKNPQKPDGSALTKMKAKLLIRTVIGLHRRKKRNDSIINLLKIRIIPEALKDALLIGRSLSTSTPRMPENGDTRDETIECAEQIRMYVRKNHETTVIL
jgi:hypothetical protein